MPHFIRSMEILEVISNNKMWPNRNYTSKVKMVQLTTTAMVKKTANQQ